MQPLVDRHITLTTINALSRAKLLDGDNGSMLTETSITADDHQRSCNVSMTANEARV